MASSALVFFLSFFFLTLCRAQDMVVSLNDTALVTNPANMWGNSDMYNPNCGGVRWMDRKSESVSMSFNGTSVTIEFLLDRVGRSAQINIDGKDIVPPINTFGDWVLVFNGDCRVVPWTSDPLPLGNHNLTITALDPPPSVTIPGQLNFRSFVYTVNDPPSSVVTQTSMNGIRSTVQAAKPTTTTAITGGGSSEQRKPSNKGAIFGAVMGTVGVVVLLGTLLLYRRRTERPLSPTTSSSRLIDQYPLDMAENPEAGPTVTTAAASTVPTPNNGRSGNKPRVQTDPITTSQPSPELAPANLSNASANPEPSTSAPVRREAAKRPRIEPRSHPSRSANGHLQTGMPSPTFAYDTPTNARLTHTQIELLQRLTEQNISGPALATVVEGMVNGERSTSPLEGSGSGPPRARYDIPPAYDYNGV